MFTSINFLVNNADGSVRFVFQIKIEDSSPVCVDSEASLDGGQIQGKDNFLKKEMETALEPLT